MRHGALILNGRPIDKRPVSDTCGTLEIQCTIWEETIDGNTYNVAMMNSQYVIDPTSVAGRFIFAALGLVVLVT